jgi:hypothetical protein
VHLAPELEHDRLGLPSRRKIGAPDARGQAAELREHDAGHTVDHLVVLGGWHQLAPFLGNAEPDQLSLGPLEVGTGLRAWRLPPLPPQEPQVGNAALV